jgi:porin
VEIVRRIAVAMCFAAVLSLSAGPAVADDENASGDATADATPYSGDFFSRSTLTGDWFGVRNDLAARGITIDASLTQVGQGVVEGGKNGKWEYGGRGEILGQLDTQKLGLWPGGFFSLELEGNYNNDVNAKTGAIMSANTNQVFPTVPAGAFNVPQLAFMQFVSPYVGGIVGKLETSGGDANEFAHGKGDDQFMNLALNINPTLVFVAPYSTLGAGIIGLPTKDPKEAIVQFSLLQANGTSEEPGFDDLSIHKLTFAGEGRMRTGFFGMTGHQLVGAGYSNKQFNSIDQRLAAALGKVQLQRRDGTWGVYYNFDQFLYEPEPEHGVGVFGRFGASDGDPNFLHYFYSLGVGSKGLIPSRKNDQFGLGYYYVDISNPTLTIGRQTHEFLRSEWGFETYYNLAITPWLMITPDLQVLGPGQKDKAVGPVRRENIDTAVVLGVRGKIAF